MAKGKRRQRAIRAREKREAKHIANFDHTKCEPPYKHYHLHHYFRGQGLVGSGLRQESGDE